MVQLSNRLTVPRESHQLDYVGLSKSILLDLLEKPAPSADRTSDTIRFLLAQLDVLASKGNHMGKFLVTYLAPASVIEEWKKTEPSKRKAAEEKMQGDWRKWMTDHAKAFADKGAGVGKTKRVVSEGISDAKNDIMLYSIIEADSHQAAAKMFEKHPHLGIPQSSIEIMEIHPLGM